MTVNEPSPAPNPPTAAGPITSDRNSEARRAYREWWIAIALLQQRWPAAFPETPQQIRPLIAGLTPLIATALDWSHPYTRAVLRTWKMRPAFGWQPLRPAGRRGCPHPGKDSPRHLGQQTPPAHAAKTTRR